MTNSIPELTHEQPPLANRVARLAPGKDDERTLIWLRVVRTGRDRRRLRALTSRPVPTLYVGFLDEIFSPRPVGWNTHSYHVDWVL